MNTKTILVTGGLGFIGSHTVCQLWKNGYHPIIIDDLSNSNRSNLVKIESVIGESITFYEGCYADKALLTSIHHNHHLDAVILFAGSKYVAESISNPLLYYQNNVANSISLFEFLIDKQINKLIFSSSATVYGDNTNLPIKEDEPHNPPSPYGRTKSMIEQIIEDISLAHPLFNASLLRYFNPTGAHPSGLLGEDYGDKANNLMPIIMQAVTGKRPFVTVFGDDYATKDGTGIRDYIHVMDLADGHVAALNQLIKSPKTDSYNLGTGVGYSVLEMIASFEKNCAKAIPYQVLPRREGDIAVSYADVEKAKNKLSWQSTRTLDNMTHDVWYYLNKQTKMLTQ